MYVLYGLNLKLWLAVMYVTSIVVAVINSGDVRYINKRTSIAVMYVLYGLNLKQNFIAVIYVLYGLNLKLWLRKNPVSKSFYCVRKPYRGLKLKLLRGRNDEFKINQDRIMTLTQQRRYLSLNRNIFFNFFTGNSIMSYREFISRALSTLVLNELVDSLA